MRFSFFCTGTRANQVSASLYIFISVVPEETKILQFHKEPDNGRKWEEGFILRCRYMQLHLTFAKTQQGAEVAEAQGS